MPVKIYVSRDSQGRPWPPDHSHEVRSVIKIAKNLWSAFNNKQELYLVIANLHRPSADLVMISERGIGIVELKHNYGRITRKGSTWYAGPKRIEAGSKDKGYRNPHEQVQDYAAEIRDDLVDPKGRQSWLPGLWKDRQSFKFSTAVCFTHPDAQIDSLKDSLRHSRRDTREWEDFDVLKSDEVPDWAPTLQFEVNKGWKQDFEPYKLDAKQIVDIAERLLNATEWTEILDLMPTGEPYAYLTLVEEGRRVHIFGIDREVMIIGRSLGAGMPIPERFGRVGREHAQIRREIEKAFIEDLGSKHGTFINAQRLRKNKRYRLKHGTKITLGGQAPSEKVCLLEFTIKAPLEPGETEASTPGN